MSASPLPVQRTRLVLLRHGQTDWNVSGQFQGQTDIPLNDKGLAQARRVAPLIAALKPSVVYASDSSRAMATGQQVAAQLGLPVVADARFREIHVGSWSGLTQGDMRTVDPSFGEALARGLDYRRSPEGETADEVGVRVRDALLDVAARHHGHTILVATHGLACRMGTGYLMGLDFAATWRLGSMDNCGWTVLGERPGGWHLECYNRSALQVATQQVTGEAGD